VLRRLLRNREVEAVLHYGTYVPGRPVPGALNVLCFISLAPWDPGPDARSLRNRMLRWLFERTHRSADLIVVQSETTRTFLQEHYPDTSSRLAVVRNGVSLPQLPRPRQRSGFVLLGDIYRYRRIDDVVRAYARLDDHIRSANPLIIAGNAGRDRRATRDVLRAVASAGLDTVRFAGLLARAKALELIAAARAFVSFAAVENGPNALAEACAIGTPVVLSDIPVHREFAGVHAYFACDTPTLTDALAAAALEPASDLHELAGPVDTWDAHVAALGRLLTGKIALRETEPCTAEEKTLAVRAPTTAATRR
jgi:glycosyltransferase involved in cell wall biosynthesis